MIPTTHTHVRCHTRRPPTRRRSSRDRDEGGRSPEPPDTSVAHALWLAAVDELRDAFAAEGRHTPYAQGLAERRKSNCSVGACGSALTERYFAHEPFFGPKQLVPLEHLCITACKYRHGLDARDARVVRAITAARETWHAAGEPLA